MKKLLTPTRLNITIAMLLALVSFSSQAQSQTQSQTPSQKLPQTQTINFPPMGPYTANLAPFTMKATASSGLDLNYETMTPENCRLEERVVWILAEGVCTIKATQQGDKYFKLTTKEKSFTIQPARQ